MTTTVDPDKIPADVFDTGCRILKTSVRRFFEMPGVREDYEKWLETYEKKEGKDTAEHRN